MSWFLFKRYFFSTRAGSIIRTLSWISVLAVTVGVAALVLVVSIMNGFNDSIRGKLLGAEPHVVVFGHQPETDDVLPDFLLHPDVVESHKFEQQDVIIKTIDGLFAGAVARGMDSDKLESYLSGLRPTRMERGAVEISADQVGENEVVLGIDLARSIGVYEGDQIVIIPPDYLLMPPSEIPNMDRVVVSALFSSDVPEIDSRMVFYVKGRSLRSFARAASLEKGWEVKLKDPDTSDAWAKQRLLGPQEYSTWQQRNSALFFALRMEKTIMAFFLSVCILITSFSIISVLILFITQKKAEIGVLMSLGISKSDLKKILMRFGVFLSSLGLGGGLLIGISVTAIMQKYPLRLLPSDVYYDSSLPARLDWSQIGLVAIGCVLLGVFCSWVSSTSRVVDVPAEAFKR